MQIVYLLAAAFSNPVFAKSTAESKVEATVRENAWFAALSYCETKEIVNWDCKSCKHVPKSKFLTAFESAAGGTRAVLARNDRSKELVLSYRASKSPINEENNYKVSMVPFSNSSKAMGKVHEGFFISMKSLSPKVVRGVGEAMKKYKDYSLVITGASLGASMASLSAEDLRIKLKIPNNKLKLITYGQVLTGDATFARWYNKQKYIKYRVIHKKDAIAHVPILKALGYKHHNTEIWIQENDQIKICKDVEFEDPTCSASLKEEERTEFDHLFVYDTILGPGAC